MKPGIAIISIVLLLAAADISAADPSRAAMLTEHNKWRVRVGVPRLTWSKMLETSAQAWANELKHNNRCRPQHSDSQGKYGENLYWASAVIWSDGRRETQQITPQTVVDSWTSERHDYDHSDNRCRPGKVCGHYTQVVWRSTRQVGCGHAVCPDSKDQIWVCRYAPPGNWVGEKPY